MGQQKEKTHTDKEKRERKKICNNQNQNVVPTQIMTKTKGNHNNGIRK